jgi:hypothetical protein
MRDADRVRDLNLAAIGEARRDDVLRDVARGVRGRRSTFVGSLPENAPPPWGAAPPYVSTMILRPVRPESPIGPPITNLPVGLQ